MKGESNNKIMLLSDRNNIFIASSFFTDTHMLNIVANCYMINI